MPTSQLKIMLKISDPTQNTYNEFTSDLLKPFYKGSLTLDKYPYYDPTVKFKTSLRKKIQDMDYDEMIQTFFNKEKFESVAVQFNQTKARELQDENEKLENENTNDYTQINFEFTVQCIFCTGFPVSNFFQTMEFYDPDFTRKKITFKGSKSTWDIILPSRFKKSFSYLFLNGKTYTITGVTWLNDALSHPVYYGILSKYKKYKEEKKKFVENDTKRQENLIQLNNAIHQLFIKIHCDSVIWKEDTDVLKRAIDNIVRLNSSDREMFLLRDKLRQIFSNIQAIRSDFLDITIEGDKYEDVNTFFVDYGLMEEINKEKSDDKKKQRVLELLFTYKETIAQNNDDYMSSINTLLDTFNTQTKDIKNELREIVNNIPESIFQNIESGSTSYGKKLMYYVRTLKTFLLQENMYNVVQNNLSYKNRDEKEVKELDSLISKEFQYYTEYTTALIDLSKKREISNEKWKEEAEKFTGKVKKLKKKKDQEDNLFETLIKCDKVNEQCTKSNSTKALPFLNIGIDKIDVKKSGNNLYETYINLDVIEGTLTNKNFEKLKCSYIDNVLGDAYSKQEDTEGKNYVSNTVYFPFVKRIEEVTKAMASSQKKKGGKRRRKKKKKRSK